MLLAGIGGSQAEVDALLSQLRGNLFYDGRHGVIHDALAGLRLAGHAVDTITTREELKRAERLEQVGGEAYLLELSNVAVSLLNFPTYLEELTTLQMRRWALQQAFNLKSRAESGTITAKELQEQFAEVAERAGKADHARPLIEFVKPSQAQAYIPNAGTFLVGENMISRGGLTVIAGQPGLGKSRLATTLAVALARGQGKWIGYDVRHQERTIIIQSQNSMSRIKQEFDDTPGKFDDWIRISKPAALRFSDPGFRREVRRCIQEFNAGCVIIDPWTGIATDEKLADYLEALTYVQDVCGVGETAPAIVIVAHLRKQRGGETWKPKRGRDLMHELSGSFALAAEARTVFVIQQVKADIAFPEVVVDCGKSNDGKPLDAQAFERCNGEFKPLHWTRAQLDEWYAGETAERKTITERTLAELFSGGRRAKRSLLVSELMDLGFARPTAYAALALDGRFAQCLKEDEGLLEWIAEG